MSKAEVKGRNGKWRGAVVVVGSLLLMGGVTACGNTGSGSGGGTGSNNNSSVIKIGEIGAISGDLASLGTWNEQGTQLAVDQINAKGGIHGKKIKILSLDDQGDPTVAVDDAKKLLNEGIVAAIATPESTTTLATVPVFAQAKVPQITAGEDPKLTQQGSAYVFRDDASSGVFNQTLADYVVNTLGLKRIALITNTDSFGQGNLSTMKADLKALGITPVASEVVSPSAKDFSAQLTTIKQANPQALFIGTEEVEMGLIAKQARSLGIKATFIAGQGADTSLYINTAGQNVADGTVFDTTYVSNSATPQAAAFAKLYQSKYGKAPDSHVAKAYDGAEMLIQAMENAYPHLDGQHIAQALHNLSYSGLTGDFKYNSAGEGLFKTTMGTIKNGQPVKLN